MSHDSHPSAAPESSGSGILETLSGWIRPDDAKESLTAVGMVDDAINSTVMTLRKLFALPVAGGLSALAGITTVPNKLFIGLPYSAINRITAFTNDFAARIFKNLGGAVS